jgi:hypothetical protein
MITSIIRLIEKCNKWNKYEKQLRKVQDNVSFEAIFKSNYTEYAVSPSANPIGEIGSRYPVMSMTVIGPCFLY